MNKHKLLLDNIIVWSGVAIATATALLPIFQILAYLMAIIVSTLTAIKIIRNWNK
jgi:hypothetical protein